ncbi:MAG: hypothetical protein K2I36_00470, partial [Ureaplasma sp.]|nr:hypothetical protein [Ureaplasma sp.]
VLYFMNKSENQINDNALNKKTENNRENTKPNISNSKKSNNNDKPSSNKVAIVYFSATNTTKTVAGYIKNATNGDLIEIVPEDKYTSSDLNYGDNNSRANKEQNDSSSRPKIANKIDVSTYDTIYLGYPIWWGDVPKIILTFLDTHDLNGKTVIPFCTSHSSGISASLSTLKNYNKNINWIDGKRFEISSQSEINDWIKTIDRVNIWKS